MLITPSPDCVVKHTTLILKQSSDYEVPGTPAMLQTCGLQWTIDDVIATNGFMPYMEHAAPQSYAYCTYHIYSNFHRNLFHKLNGIHEL